MRNQKKNGLQFNGAPLKILPSLTLCLSLKTLERMTLSALDWMARLRQKTITWRNRQEDMAQDMKLVCCYNYPSLLLHNIMSCDNVLCKHIMFIYSIVLCNANLDLYGGRGGGVKVKGLIISMSYSHNIWNLLEQEKLLRLHSKYYNVRFIAVPHKWTPTQTRYFWCVFVGRQRQSIFLCIFKG